MGACDACDGIRDEDSDELVIVVDDNDEQPPTTTTRAATGAARHRLEYAWRPVARCAHGGYVTRQRCAHVPVQLAHVDQVSELIK